MKDVIPFNTGKVKIGLLYMPENPYKPDQDALCIQRLLTEKPPTLLERLKHSMGWL